MLTINTVGYNIAFIFTSNFMQILCAILLSRIGNKYFKKTTQSIMFLPYFVSYVILNVIVYNLFNYDVGFINGVLRSMGSAPFDAYNNPRIWRFLMVIFYLWKQIGYGTVIYLATLPVSALNCMRRRKSTAPTYSSRFGTSRFRFWSPTFITLLLFSLGGIMKGQLTCSTR